MERRRGWLGAIVVLWLVVAGVVTAYRYWPRPVLPQRVSVAQAPSAPAPTKPGHEHVADEPTEQPQAEPRSRPAPAAPGANQPIVEIKPSAPRGHRSVSASWFEGAAGFERAKKEQEYGNVPMIIYFRVDWCPYCQRMDQDLGSSAVREFLANVVKVRINPESSPADRELANSMGVHGYPSVFAVPFPGTSPEKIQSLSRKENQPLELSAEKFISSAKDAGIRQAHNQMVEGTDKLRRGDTAGARADLDRAIEMNPNDADAYYWRGEADARAGELGKAVGNFKRALELEPDRKDALFGLAQLYSRNREWDEAIKYLTRAIRVDPDYAQGTAFAQRGYVNKMKGDLAAAKADFAEACSRGTSSACAEAK